MTFALPASLFHRTLLSIVLALSMLQTASVAASDWDIDQLMLALSKAQPGRASFVEKKHIAMLDRPLESSGELRFTAPDRLEKRTFKPKPEAMLVEGGVLVIERGKKKYTLQLQDYPELAGFIDSFRSTLAGDRKALERSYKLRLEGGNEQWLLLLTPSDAKMAAIVRQVSIAGSRDQVRSIDVIQTDGDYSKMRIEALPAQ